MTNNNVPECWDQLKTSDDFFMVKNLNGMDPYWSAMFQAGSITRAESSQELPVFAIQVVRSQAHTNTPGLGFHVSSFVFPFYFNLHNFWDQTQALQTH